MRAMRVHAYGGPDQLTLEDIAQPYPGPQEVLVRIHACSVNPVDWKMRAGLTKERYPLRFPAILGRDFAGVVAGRGDQVSAFDIGDPVYGYCAVNRDGSYADYIALPAEQVSHSPRSLTMAGAAAIPTVALTAYIALFEYAALTSGQSVLIHAGAGGVGSIAIQFARWAGAQVYATGSNTSAGLLRSLGANVVIDYRRERFEEVARNIDVVLDGVGGDTLERSWSCLRPGGALATIVARPAPGAAEAHNCRGSWVGARPDGGLLQRFATLIDAGHIRPVLDRVLPLTDAAEAHRLSEAGHVHGKIVLQVA